MSKDLNNSNSSSSFEEELEMINDCPVCEQEESLDQIEVLEKRDGSNLVHITCSECGSAVLAIIVVTNLGASSVGMITDLRPEDVKKLRKRSPISHEEVLQFHLSLQNSKMFESAIMSDV